MFAKSFIAVFALLVSGLSAQVTTINFLGAVPAKQGATGLGFNVPGDSGTQDWGYATAAAIGATITRSDACNWNAIEQANNDNTSAGFSIAPGSACDYFLLENIAYGMIPSPNILGDPPGPVGTNGTATAASAIGAYTIQVSSNLAAMASECFDSNSQPRCVIVLGTNEQISADYTYLGTLITAFASNVITIASPLTVAITNTEALTIRATVYSPINLLHGGPFLTDPSTQAYANAVTWLAGQMKNTYHTAGQIELTNEPPYQGLQLWLTGQLLYNPRSTALNQDGAYPTQFAAAARTPVTGVGIISNWCNVAGSQDPLFIPGYLQTYTTVANAQANGYSCAFHPYGAWPESDNWLPSCVSAQGLLPSPNFFSCLLISSGSSFVLGAGASAQPFEQGGIQHSVTETGTYSSVSDTTVAPRFDLRQWTAFQFNGVSPIIFYALSCTNSPFDFVSCESPPTYYPVATDFQAYMTDIRSIANDPVGPAFVPCNLPHAGNYSGTWPLSYGTFVGRRSGESRNSLLIAVWQMTYPTGSQEWATIAHPTPVTEQFAIPPHMTVLKAVDLIGSGSITASLSGQVLSVSVADDPIEILLVPDGVTLTTGATCTLNVNF